ncbi:hypothetical protein A9G45_00060 [Gilliamella sp. HK2]|uniref:DUF6708 domain-containing protein n=1 Tax=unclassified Gilliamella TaxID=2685620 RepID=UPI00080EC827|nr:DUF6708 domain-containing protein [Gilliamella apicola]OCG29857.1 hypothetical protein A9G46_12530 [Gilliamella apicola]OCG30202.1 hypothetical protein A9G45_00060 [Gilliamella apicola]
MPSQYRPQIFGWISDLDKGGNYLTGADDRLLYANDNYCAFIRKTKSDQIFYLCIYLIVLIFLTLATILWILLVFLFNIENESKINILGISAFTICCVAIYLIIPEIYQNLFTRRGSPIIFNRKTGKVYINESYFFNFKVLRNPLTFLHPNKKRIKEYDWAHLQGVVVHNFSRYSLNTTILMVCKPHSHKTIDHILLDPLRVGIGSYLVWGWVNNFMCANKLAGLNDGKYKWEQETQFKDKIIKGQGWPEWMVEAFNATSQEELAEIKQRYHIKQ